ncbi:MFS transporter [Fictibacillus phosphorivorans]|uniref:MFS transporter n=1 Tax=Fictibacillus phosphorivorans TaxID=1221500 RepID=UPI00203AD8D6|nr:MFS transporter [Fictibacillus phosphorivorans]MCM3718808.1 MFS transporter [Fictibacillus phosphorivorans]MCM3776431.1 MFS transporter [Fictibacillus phosphorivorans]
MVIHDSYDSWTMGAQVAPIIQNMYGLSDTKLSLLIAIPVLLGSLMRIPLGIASDRYGGRKVYTVTMLALVIPLVGIGYAASFEMLLFWTFLIGLAGATFAIAISYVSAWYTFGKQGYVLGVVGLGNIGSAISGFTIPTMVTELGLSWTFWGGAILMGLMTIIFWLFTKEAPLSNKKMTVKEAFSVMKYRSLWMLSMFYFLTFGGFVAFSLYLPTLLKGLYQVSLVDVGMKTAWFVVIATFIRPFGSYLADRFGAKMPLMFLFVGTSVISILIPLVVDNSGIFTFVFLLLGLFLGAGNGAVFKLVPEVAPGKTGASAGIIGAIGGIGGFILPLVFGMTKDMIGSYTPGFVLFSIFSALCLIGTIRSVKDGKRSSHKNVKVYPSIQ